MGAPIVFVGGCMVSCGVALSGNGHVGDTIGGLSLFGALAMFLGGIVLNRHIRVAEQPKQTITLRQLLSNPSFSIYAFDNAKAKAVDMELRDSLTRLKDTLLVNMDIRQSETFEL